VDARDGVPAAYQEAAEEVRAHLVCLRGRGLFLSSSDSLQLVRWLDEGVAVPDILRALERAAEARRRKRSKVPLRLSHAKRHLGRPTQGSFARERPVGPGAAMAPVVRALAVSPRRSEALAVLEERLEALEGRDAEALFRQAAAVVRDFLAARWGELSGAERGELEAEARAELGDLADVVDENTLRELLAEGARDRLRAGYPALSAASLWEVAEARADGS